MDLNKKHLILKGFALPFGIINSMAVTYIIAKEQTKDINCSLSVTNSLNTRIRNRVRCGQTTTVLCQQVCNKVLNCLTHRCMRICHTGTVFTCILRK